MKKIACLILLVVSLVGCGGDTGAPTTYTSNTLGVTVVGTIAAYSDSSSQFMVRFPDAAPGDTFTFSGYLHPGNNGTFVVTNITVNALWVSVAEQVDEPAGATITFEWTDGTTTTNWG